MESLVDFLNHGFLPFRGRSTEQSRIVTCWRHAIEAQELHALLILGEAGIGKSRLLDATIPEVERAGGTVIRAKLFAESGASVIPVIAEALWYNEETRRLHKGEPGSTVDAVAAHLRRVLRLRPTLLVIEDIHLLSGDAVRELSRLLTAVAEDALALVVTARPSDLEARPLLERFVLQEVVLGGLSCAEVEEIWSALFDRDAEQAVATTLFDVTGGNPLALRAALRMALRSGVLHQDPITHRWSPTESAETYRRSLQRSVDLLAEGMAANLDDAERQAAVRLAWLGEVFARETAQAMIEGADRMVDLLLFKGILFVPPVPTPALPGAMSRLPLLAFTHSLLHQHLTATSQPPAEALISAVASGLPLYSTLPLQHLGAGDHPWSGTAEELRALVERTLAIARHLDLGPTWRDALRMWEAAEGAFTAVAGRLEPDVRIELHARLLNRRLSLMRRSIDPVAYRATIDRIMEMTTGAESVDILEQRLGALRYLHTSRAQTAADDAGDDAAPWDLVDAMVHAVPELRGRREYVLFLRDVANTASRRPDVPMLRRVEVRAEELLALEDLAPALRTLALHQVVPHFLHIFDSAEELLHRRTLLEQVSNVSDGGDAHFLIHRVTFLESTGHFAEAAAAAERGIEIFSAMGLARNVFRCTLARICARAAAGEPLATIEQEAVRLCGAAPRDLAQNFRRNTAIYLSEAGLLRGDAAWTHRILERFAPNEPPYTPTAYLLLGDNDDTTATALDRFLAAELQEESELALAQLAREAKANGAVSAATAADATRLLEQPILRTSDLVTLHGVLALIGTAPLDAPVRARIAHAIAHALEWLAQRGVGGYMLPLIERGERFLVRRDASHWRTEARRFIERDGGNAALDGEGRMRVSMLGTIAVESADGEAQALRGARLRTVLGLLAATRMVKTPLTNNEFCRIAAGGELDIDLARKTMNMAITRLREAIGPDAIITGPQTHELNPDLVEIDLVEADRLLRESTAALRRRALALAFPALMRVLDITRGEVAFPGLYDDFFEALREDFENRLRHAVIDLGRAMLLESDVDNAARLLERAFDAVPDDEEIADLLREALAALNDRTAAERVRMRVEESP